MKRKFLLIGLITTLELGASITLFAQHNNKPTTKSITKEITIDDTTGDKKMVITTTENEITTIEEITGDEVDLHLAEDKTATNHKKVIIKVDEDMTSEKNQTNVKTHNHNKTTEEIEPHLTEGNIDKIIEELLDQIETTEYHDASSIDENVKKRIIIKEMEEDIEIENSTDGDQQNLLNKEEIDFQLYPNPSTGKFTIEFGFGTKKKIDVLITDIDGKEVYNKSVKGDENYNLPIDISKESKGSYFIRLTQGNNNIMETIVIE